MRFGGSTTATSDTHINVIAETVGCPIIAGFSKVLIVNGHGGNEADMAVALQKIKEVHEDSQVFATSHWRLVGPQLAAIKEAGPLGSGHAGEMETSMMLVIRPDLVKAERPDLDGIHPELAYGELVSHFQRMDERTRVGVHGDPTFGTAEKGERMLEAIVDGLVDVVHDIQSGQLWESNALRQCLRMALLGEHTESEGRRQEGDKHYFLRQRPESEESFVYEAELPVTIPEADPRVVEDHAGMMRIPVSGSSMTLSACGHARDRILCNLS